MDAETPIYNRLVRDRETPIFDALAKKYEWAKYESLVEPYQPTNKGEKLMKKTWQELVTEFREAMDLPISHIPRTLSPAEAELHIKMIRDEFEQEFVPAAQDADPQNLVNLYDAGIDLIVYILGAMTNAGLDVDPAFRIVMDSNMSKMDPITGLPIKAGPNDPSGEPEGKVLKGPNYWKPEPKLWEIINQTFQEGPREESVYRSEHVPVTWDLGGPVVGEADVYMDHQGNLMIEGVIQDTNDIPELKSVVMASIDSLGVYIPDEPKEPEAAEDQSLPGGVQANVPGSESNDLEPSSYIDSEGRVQGGYAV